MNFLDNAIRFDKTSNSSLLGEADASENSRLLGEQEENYTEEEPKNSSLSAYFLLLNATLDVGLLSQPYVFKQAGIGITLVLYTFFCLLCNQSAALLLQCAKKTGMYDFSGLGEIAYGHYGALLVDFSVFINSVGYQLSYLVMLGTFIDDFKYYFFDTTFSVSWYFSRPFLLGLIVLCWIFPLCMVRNLGKMAFASRFTLAILCSVILLVLIGGPVHYSSSSSSALVNWKFIGTSDGLFGVLGDITFLFGYSASVFQVFVSMQQKHLGNYLAISKANCFSVFFLCLSIGIVGYMSFGSETRPNILENFDSKIGYFFKVLLTMQLILYFPMDFILLRQSFMGFFSLKAESVSFIFLCSVTGCLLGLLTVIAAIILCIEDSSTGLAIIFVINWTGGIAGSLVNFVLPGLLAIKILGTQRERVLAVIIRKTQAVGLTVVGLCVMSIVAITAFPSLLHDFGL